MNTKHRTILLTVLIAGMLALAGCVGADTNEDSGDQLANDTGMDTGDIGVTDGESYYYEVAVTESNQQDLVRAHPPFEMDSSLERQNLIDRYEYLNDQNNQHHVYMLGNDGTVISYFVAQGKVSSVNSKLTNDKQIVEIKGAGFRGGQGAGAYGPNYRLVESPQMDGSYGENGDAIFFFTTSGEYVEWNGKYLVSEEPMDINTPVSLQQQVDGDDDEGE